MAAAAPRPASLRSAVAIAWPASLAAIVTPLLGLIDVAVLARGAAAGAMAGAALASAVFSLLYWTFGFLRMSLSGLSAQATGAGDERQLRTLLVQGGTFGLATGALLLALAGPIIAMSEAFLIEGTEASPEAGEAMRTYIRVRLWAAPAVLMTTAVLGWLTGQGRTGLMMFVTVGMAAINAALSVWLVLVLDRGIAGLAAATAMAEVAGLLLAVASAAFVLQQRGGVARNWDPGGALHGVRALLSLNRDIFLRTLILDAVFLSFARLGAGFGDLTVAANHVLLNLVLTASLILDGPAIAAETFVGQALGATRGRRALFDAAWRRTAEVTAALAVVLMALLVALGGPLLAITIGRGPEAPALIAEAQTYLPWAMAMPVAVAAAYHLDGVYIGATRGTTLRNAMAGSGIVFAVAAAALMPPFGNHGLWLALLLFMVARALLLVIAWRGFGPLITTSANP